MDEIIIQINSVFQTQHTLQPKSKGPLFFCIIFSGRQIIMENWPNERKRGSRSNQNANQMDVVYYLLGWCAVLIIFDGDNGDDDDDDVAAGGDDVCDGPAIAWYATFMADPPTTALLLL